MYVAASGISRTLSRRQQSAVQAVLDQEVGPGDTLITGGAYGVDTCAALWALGEGIAVFLYVPRDLLWHRELGDLSGVGVEEVPGTYMERNEAIAESSAEKLLAFPYTKREHLRSGTWATVRRFEQRMKPTRVTALSQFR